MLKLNLKELLEVYQIDKKWYPRPDSRFPLELVIDGKRRPVIDHQVIYRTEKGFISVAAEETGIARVLKTSDVEESESLRFYIEVESSPQPTISDHIWIDVAGEVSCGVMAPPRVPFRRIFWERKFDSRASKYNFGLDADQMALAMRISGRTVIVKNRDGILVVAKFNDKQLLKCFVKKGYSNVKLAKETIHGYNKLQLNPGLKQVIVEVE